VGHVGGKLRRSARRRASAQRRRVRLCLLGGALTALSMLALSPSAVALTPPSLDPVGGILPTPPPAAPSTTGLSQPPGVPVANPLVAPLGDQPRAAAAPCHFVPPHGSTPVTTVYTAPDDAASHQALVLTAPGRARFSVDPWNPCHLFRSYPDRVERSDDAGAHWTTVFIDPAQSYPASLGGPAAAAGYDDALLSPLMHVAPGQAYLVDSGGSAGDFFTPDEGATWSQRDGGLVTAPYEATFPLRRQFADGLEPVEGDSGVRALAFAPSDPATGYLVASAAGETLLYRTRDGGSSWLALPVPQPELDTVVVDPADAAHLFVAGGGGWTATGTGATAYQQTTSAQGVPAKGLWESADGGLTWAHLDGPAGASPVQLVATRASDHTGAPNLHLYAQVMAEAAAAGSMSLEPYSSADGGHTWTHFPLPPGWTGIDTLPVTLQSPWWSVLVADPVHPQTMLWAVANGESVDMALSVDGFATATHARVVEPQGITGMDVSADRFDDFFVGTVHQDPAKPGYLDTLRTLHVEPGSPPAWAIRSLGQVPTLATCTLPAIDPLDSNPRAREQQSTRVGSPQSQTLYWNGSLAYDGRYLDYSQDDLAPGVIYRIDPVTCQAASPIRLDSLRTYQGAWNRPAIEALSYDPTYRFADGHLGALLARGHRNDDASVADPANHAPVYAVDLQAADGSYHLAFSVPCNPARTDNYCDSPTAFTYDLGRSAMWVWVRGTPREQFLTGTVGLERLPADPRAAPSLAPTCMSATDWSSSQNEPFGPFAMAAAAWAANGRGLLYAQNEDEESVYTVDAVTCTVLSSFQHRAYQDAVEDIEQLACDPLTYGDRLGAARARSVLWLRDVNPNTVSAYPIPDSGCPVPTAVHLAALAPVVAGSSVSLCASLIGDVARDTPLSGHTLVFTAGNAMLSAVTDLQGTACTARLRLDDAGRLAVRVAFAGTASYLASLDTGTLTVAATVPLTGGPGGPSATGSTPSAPVAPAPDGVVPAPSDTTLTQPPSQANSQTQSNQQPAIQAGLAVQEQHRRQVATQLEAPSPEQPQILQAVAGQRPPSPPPWTPGLLAGLLAIGLGWLVSRSPEPHPALAPPSAAGPRRCTTHAARRRRRRA